MRARFDPLRRRFAGLGLAILVIDIGLGVAACSSGPPAASSGAAPSVAGVSPSGDSGLAAAATAYLAAADAAKSSNAALAAQYSGSLTLAQGRAYYEAAAAIDATYLAAVKAIAFPPAAAADATAMIDRVTADQALDVRGSTVLTAAGMDLVRSARPADLAAVAAAGNELRADLGLPAAP